MAKLTTFKPRRLPGPELRLNALSAEAARVEARGTAAERGYDYWWQVNSTAFRKRYPSCAYCWLENRAGPAQMVDHLYPHGIRRGFDTPDQRRLFRDKTYWVSSCHEHHRGFKASIEAKGIMALDDLALSLGLEALSDEVLRRVVTAALTVRA